MLSHTDTPSWPTNITSPVVLKGQKLPLESKKSRHFCPTNVLDHRAAGSAWKLCTCVISLQFLHTDEEDNESRTAATASFPVRADYSQGDASVSFLHNLREVHYQLPHHVSGLSWAREKTPLYLQRPSSPEHTSLLLFVAKIGQMPWILFKQTFLVHIG